MERMQVYSGLQYKLWPSILKMQLSPDDLT